MQYGLTMHLTRLRSIPKVLAFGCALMVVAPRPGTAQETLGTLRRQATRAELEQAIAGAEAVARGADEKTRAKLERDVVVWRQRLRNGDFVPGDRLLLTVLGDSALTDTFTVRPDQKLSLPDIPDISLRGVLDSELMPHLTKELSRYLKSPQVTATGLVRVSLSGAIGKPGFMVVPVDQLISDVLMSAGGPGQTAMLQKAHVKRADKTVLDGKQFAEALRTGRSVGDVSLRDGDEIIIPVQSATRGVAGWWPVVAGVVMPLFWIFRGTQNRNPTP